MSKYVLKTNSMTNALECQPSERPVQFTYKTDKTGVFGDIHTGDHLFVCCGEDILQAKIFTEVVDVVSSDTVKLKKLLEVSGGAELSEDTVRTLQTLEIAEVSDDESANLLAKMVSAFCGGSDAEGEAEEEQTVKFNTGYKSSFMANRIFFGAPGTGKSFTLNLEKEELLANGGFYERVTFHPDYSYANFVGTYKPVMVSDDISYEYVPGPFMRVYVKALKNARTDDPKPHLLIIEEINRANAAAVFGDIFQLLDRDDDSVSEYPIQASEDIKKYLARELGGRFDDYSEIKIPDNMFIWATMNSADQGVFPMDTAFKRRWDFTYLGIDESEDGIKDKKVVLGTGDNSRLVEWNELRKEINRELLTYKINEDKLLGPYFISKKALPQDDSIDANEFCRIFKSKVIMYLFDDAAKQKRLTLFSGCEEQSRNQYSKICQEFDTKGVNIFCERIRAKFTDRPGDMAE